MTPLLPVESPERFARELLDTGSTQAFVGSSCSRFTPTAVTSSPEPGRPRIVDRRGGGMRKNKGLEWPCVVVTNGRRGLRRDTSETASERLFTAMTRTTALLVVVLWQDGDVDTTALLGRLDGDRLLFCDAAASAAFHRARQAGASDVVQRAGA